MKIVTIEKNRVEEQTEIDKKRSLEERNMNGQYSTPNDLANEIIQFVLKIRDKLIGSNEKITFFEPAFGTGSFYSALIQSTKKEMLEYAFGLEVDKEICDVAKHIWNDYDIEIQNSDFTHYKQKDNQLFNLVVTNPPYVRHHHLTKEQKNFLRQEVKKELGLTISGYAGLYCYFILLTHKWLIKGAISSWLIPSEFMDVNYGRVIKEYLTNSVTIKHIHKYDYSSSYFTDAIVSSSVITYVNEVPKGDEEVKLTFGGTITKPNMCIYKKLKELRNIDKWSNFFLEAKSPISAKEHTLSDFFDIKRGIATGNNGFFILSEKQIMNMGLPFECLRPILPPPRNLNQDIIEADNEGIPILDERLFVIDTDLDEDTLKRKYPEFWNYLHSGILKGITEGYLVKSRKIWYSQEKRNPVPFLCTYMGRDNNNNNPFKFILNKSLAIASNSFILLYPKGKLKELLDNNISLFPIVLDALKKIKVEHFYSEGREYGGGLRKIEPKELARVNANDIMDIPGLK